ncbi:MAG: hypothetical protein PHY02_06455 [Phycisphaerae bacterium]|nr:hypothetical protein [Phycisphaerae bacterium]
MSKKSFLESATRIKRSFGVVHATAECEDCGWRNEQYKNAQATAAIHARNTNIK